MCSEATDPTPANPFAEHDIDSNQPAEARIAEVPLDPTNPDDLQRLLQALRKL